ncbi:hypothetical protein EAS54_19030 [Bradyrhizobium guangzhouense]|nr:hypothetical protein EAS54_19030 [Bradyrhizobium guangzhouense]
MRRGGWPEAGRHSGAVRRTEPGISRFRVRCFASARNDSLYGFKIDAPVVLRLSRSICAFAASFSA